jgi:hypothetical protein
MVMNLTRIKRDFDMYLQMTLYHQIKLIILRIDLDISKTFLITKIHFHKSFLHAANQMYNFTVVHTRGDSMNGVLITPHL